MAGPKPVLHFKRTFRSLKCVTGLGSAMVGICDIKGDRVTFRDREGGEYLYTGKVPLARKHRDSNIRLDLELTIY